MQKLKRLTRILATLALVLFFCMQTSAQAKEVEEEKEYKPIDLVLVIDGSGSMRDSDPSRTAISAGRMLTNMMPASDSRIAIISFNTEATVHTSDHSGSGALLSLDTFANVESVREALAEIKYSGDTGIGNALYAAIEILQQQSDDTRQGAIILFTDGTNDFNHNAIALAQCEENEALALKQAKKLGYPVYCVGYDYKLPTGESSMGDDGEGLKKLQNIADTTGGTPQSISSIDEMEQLLIEFLADICDIIYDPIDTIPGDGGEHTVPISVSPSVAEMNIRIAGVGKESISKGAIHLHDPNGGEITLTNSGNVRYDVDATAASIKVIMPQPGDWSLTVSGIQGDDIHVGKLEHFKMNLKSKLVFPDGNPDGVVYAHDKLGIEAWLTYDGVDLKDNDLYETVTSATATFVSRADESDNTVVDLMREGTVFKGNFEVPADSFYDITIRINWDSVYRESKLEVMSSNKPLELVDEIEDVTVNKNKSVSIDNIFQYVYDLENDPITAEVKSVGTPDVADVSVNGDSIVVTGRKWSSTLITILFRDEQGNTVESTFTAKVNDPIALALIIGGIVLMVLVALGVTYLIYRRTFRIRGTMRVRVIKEQQLKDGEIVGERVIFEDRNHLNGDAHATPLFNNGTNTPGMQDMTDPFASSTGGFGFVSVMTGGVPGDNPSVSTADFSGLDPYDGSADPFTAGNPFGSPTVSFGTTAPLDSSFVHSDTGDADGSNSFTMSSLPDTPSTNPFDGNGPYEDGRLSEEELEDQRLNESFDDGLLELGSIVGHSKSTNMLEVAKAFRDAYVNHMTPMHRRSLKAEQVEAFINGRLNALSEVVITGSPRGKQGIVVQLFKKTSLAMQSPRTARGKVVTKQYGKKPIIFSFSIPTGSEDSRSYVEFEYLPPI